MCFFILSRSVAIYRGSFLAEKYHSSVFAIHYTHTRTHTYTKDTYTYTHTDAQSLSPHQTFEIIVRLTRLHSRLHIVCVGRGHLVEVNVFKKYKLFNQDSTHPPTQKYTVRPKHTDNCVYPCVGERKTLGLVDWWCGIVLCFKLYEVHVFMLKHLMFEVCITCPLDIYSKCYFFGLHLKCSLPPLASQLVCVICPPKRLVHTLCQDSTTRGALRLEIRSAVSSL